MEDNAIIELFFDRSEQAIRELDGKYGKVCHSLSYNILHSSQDAEECVNDAYLGTWNAIPPARPNPLLAFLCRIVRNLSHAVSCGKSSQAGRRELHRVAGGVGGLSGLAPDCGGGAGGTGTCPADRGFPGNAVPGEPCPAHAPVLVLRQLWGDRGADRLIGKERVRPADPYPKAVAALF